MSLITNLMLRRPRLANLAALQVAATIQALRAPLHVIPRHACTVLGVVSCTHVTGLDLEVR